jgi:hypothetical protein
MRGNDLPGMADLDQPGAMPEHDLPSRVSRNGNGCDERVRDCAHAR